MLHERGRLPHDGDWHHDAQVLDTAIRLTERRLVRFSVARYSLFSALVAAIDFGKRRRNAST
jgi:hypothetical protein